MKLFEARTFPNDALRMSSVWILVAAMFSPVTGCSPLSSSSSPPPECQGEDPSNVDPDPALVCDPDTASCEPGTACLPTACVPSSCDCDSSSGTWVCTADCLSWHECLPDCNSNGISDTEEGGGACELGDDCLDTLQECCDDLGGAYQGDDTPCSGGDASTGGGVRFSGQILAADTEAPLIGVVVSLGESGTTTDQQGRFEFTELAAGEHKLKLDASTVTTATGRYGEFQSQISLEDGEIRVVERPFYLPFLPTASLVMVSDLQRTLVSPGNGVVLDIPAGAVLKDGEVYTGEICVCTLPWDRTPASLPDRFRDQLAGGEVVTIQPAGLVFATPAQLTMTWPAIPNQFGDFGEIRSLWSLDHNTGLFFNAGIGASDGFGTVSTIAGGVRESSWHFFTDYELKLLKSAGFDPSCIQGGPAFARNCVRSYFSLLGKAATIASGQVPGAAPVVSRFKDVLENRFGGAAANELERAANTISGKVIDAVGNEITIVDLHGAGRITARQVVGYMQKIAAPPLLDDFRNFARDAQRTANDCDFLRNCKLKSIAKRAGPTLSAFPEQTLEELIAEAEAIFEEHHEKFEPFADAYDGLTPYFDQQIALTDATLPGWQAAVSEYVRTYEDFAPYDSPMEAYEAFTARINEVERRIRESIDEITEAQDGEARVVTVCDSTFNEDLPVGEDGLVAITIQTTPTGEVLDECTTVVAVDFENETCSLPMGMAELVEGLGTPALLPLDREITASAASSGTLTDDSPVHISGLGGGALQVDQMSMFSVEEGIAFRAQVASENATALTELYAMSPPGETGLPYEIVQELFSFGEPAPMTFFGEDRQTLLIRKGASNRILIEKRNNLGLLFHALFDVDANELERIDYANGNVGKADETYDVAGDQLYRLVLDHEGSSERQYEVVVHNVPDDPAPTSISTGMTIDAVFDQHAEHLVYEFTGTAGQPLTLFGTDREFFEMIVFFTVLDSAGTPIVEEAWLEFQGWDFEPFLSFTPTTSGPHTAVFKTSLQDPYLGSFSFRIDPVQP